MTTPLNKALSAAILRLLKPLVRILLRNGVTYGAFADLAKRVFVDVAREDFAVDDRKQTDSRVSVITGLTRKEVARIKKIDAPDDADAAQQYNRAARVISGWLRDKRYTNDDGSPVVLPFDGNGKANGNSIGKSNGNGASFTELVKAYSGDMTARSILDELLRVGAVERDQQGNIRLLVSAYVPKGSDAGKLHILGNDVALLIGTIDYNLQEEQQQPRFQRKVAYDNLPVEALPQLRKLTNEYSQTLLQEIDRYLAQQDRDVHPDVQGTGRKHAGIGIYYFEEDMPEEK
jgi:hypothetical protein